MVETSALKTYLKDLSILATLALSCVFHCIPLLSITHMEASPGPSRCVARCLAASYVFSSWAHPSRCPRWACAFQCHYPGTACWDNPSISPNTVIMSWWWDKSCPAERPPSLNSLFVSQWDHLRHPNRAAGLCTRYKGEYQCSDWTQLGSLKYLYFTSYFMAN